MIVKTKHGPICCDIYRDTEGLADNIYFCRIIATDNQFNEMGHLNFSIKENGDVWLYHIQTNDVFQYRGVGQAMLDTFELFCATRGCEHIEGRFYPENSYAEKFYEKNDYSIFEDSYRYYVAKSLRRTKVLAEKSPKLEGELVVGDYQDYLKEKAEKEEIFDTISKRQADKINQSLKDKSVQETKTSNPSFEN